jgi:hypothetical protein
MNTPRVHGLRLVCARCSSTAEVGPATVVSGGRYADLCPACWWRCALGTEDEDDRSDEIVWDLRGGSR